MKNKILLMLILGVSFGPAVFASDSKSKLGQKPLSEIPQVGIACNGPLDKNAGPLNAEFSAENTKIKSAATAN